MKEIGKGSDQECLVVSKTIIHLHFEWGGDNESYNFTTIQFAYARVGFLQNQIIVIAQNVLPSDKFSLRVVRLNLDGSFISNKKIGIAMAPGNSIK